MLASLLAVMTKEVRQTLRDRRMMFLLIGAPLIQLLIFGNAVSYDVDQVPTVIVDHDDTAASRQLLQRMMADGTLAPISASATSWGRTSSGPAPRSRTARIASA